MQEPISFGTREMLRFSAQAPPGNTDRRTPVVNDLPHFVTARHVRVQVIEWRANPPVRAWSCCRVKEATSSRHARIHECARKFWEFYKMLIFDFWSQQHCDKRKELLMM